MGIIDFLFKNTSTRLTFNKNMDALTQVFNAHSFYGEEKHIFNQKIIEHYSSSNNPNDLLAVAFANSEEGYQYRKQSIQYFEKYLSNPSSQKLFDKWYIYSSLAKLYENEYMFDKAIECLEKLPKLDNNSNPADFTRIGDILIKIDIDRAISYYCDLKKEKIYSIYKDFFDTAYIDILEKKKKGYVYKPRKKK